MELDNKIRVKIPTPWTVKYNLTEGKISFKPPATLNQSELDYEYEKTDDEEEEEEEEEEKVVKSCPRKDMCSVFLMHHHKPEQYTQNCRYQHTEQEMSFMLLNRDELLKMFLNISQIKADRHHKILNQLQIQAVEIVRKKPADIATLTTVIQAGVDPNLSFLMQNNMSSNLLWEAASHPDPNLVKCLLELKADPRKFNVMPTPLYISCFNNVEVSWLLMEAGDSPFTRWSSADSRKFTPICHLLNPTKPFEQRLITAQKLVVLYDSKSELLYKTISAFENTPNKEFNMITALLPLFAAGVAYDPHSLIKGRHQELSIWTPKDENIAEINTVLQFHHDVLYMLTSKVKKITILAKKIMEFQCGPNFVTEYLKPILDKLVASQTEDYEKEVECVKSHISRWLKTEHKMDLLYKMAYDCTDLEFSSKPVRVRRLRESSGFAVVQSMILTEETGVI